MPSPPSLDLAPASPPSPPLASPPAVGSLEEALAQTVVVLPAFNAERTLERVVRQVPEPLRERILLVDDASLDGTVAEAERLGLRWLQHERNRGYGGNQKTCYRQALDAGARFVVMLHPDDQYDGRVIPVAVELMRLGIADVVLGNRI
ncbi:MAG: glycosyltransferase family 2 protein, partial [Acidobacteriota bacterium]